jgi:hypothetical protein
MSGDGKDKPMNLGGQSDEAFGGQPDGDQSNSMLIYHRLGQQFQGTAEEVVRALYEDSRRGMNNISFEDWWKYQTKLWKAKYNIDVPEIRSEGAFGDFLKIQIQVGALQEGPVPPDTTMGVHNG